ncbi:MAG TPA: 2-oxoacid:acceptor oxidoreductase family protein [Thermodesulfovibrionales bacterium]|nr:2-oxoacid:acceptor oxidoreductase family protein [Thermodesulfovibrionales bacterium]
MKSVGILVAGFGGQGILLLGRLIAYSGMLEGKEVTCFPSYGAEMRGGTANSTVIVSDEMIGSPIMGNPDILIAMNEASLKRFQPKIKSGGVLIFDSSLISSPEIRGDIHVIHIPATEIAASIAESEAPNKNPVLTATRVRSANMVMFGALLAKTGIVKVETAIHALERLTSSKREKTLKENKKAVMRGVAYIASKKSKDN